MPNFATSHQRTPETDGHIDRRMGGAIPSGYDVKEKAHIVNADEAAAIRAIFQDIR